MRKNEALSYAAVWPAGGNNADAEGTISRREIRDNRQKSIQILSPPRPPLLGLLLLLLLLLVVILFFRYRLCLGSTGSARGHLEIRHTLTLSATKLTD